MLILTRRVGESLMIGDNVDITVLGIRGNQVRIGINAPKDCLLYTSPSPRDKRQSRMPSSA